MQQSTAAACTDQEQGDFIVKRFAFIAAVALACGAPVPADAIEILTNSRAASPPPVRLPDLAVVPGKAILPTSQLSELPEPEVFAMMLLGLVLIGYRASRDSSEKFK